MTGANYEIRAQTDDDAGAFTTATNNLSHRPMAGPVAGMRSLPGPAVPGITADLAAIVQQVVTAAVVKRQQHGVQSHWQFG